MRVDDGERILSPEAAQEGEQPRRQEARVRSPAIRRIQPSWVEHLQIFIVQSSGRVAHYFLPTRIIDPCDGGYYPNGKDLRQVLQAGANKKPEGLFVETRIVGAEAENPYVGHAS